jgi:hypothetical protein
VLLDISPLRRHPDFRLLFIGQFVSFFGSMITYVAVPYQLYQLTGSSLAVGLLGTVQLVPLLLSALWGGAYADAMDRRRLLIGAEILLAVISLGFAVNALLPHPSVAAIFVLAAAASAVTGFHRPTLEAMSPRLVDRDELPATAALSALRGILGAVAGPAVGRHLRRALRDGRDVPDRRGTFVVSLVALARMADMPAAAEAAKPGLRSIVEGLDYARRRPELIGTYVVDIVAMTFAMPTALFPALAQRWGGATAAGWLYAAMPARQLRDDDLLGLDEEGLAARRRRRARGRRVGRRDRGARPRRQPPDGARLPRARGRSRRGERALPHDDLERDHPDAPARPARRRRDDQLHDRAAARERARGLDGVAALDALLDRDRRLDLPRGRPALHPAAAGVLALPPGRSQRRVERAGSRRGRRGVIGRGDGLAGAPLGQEDHLTRRLEAGESRPAARAPTGLPAEAPHAATPSANSLRPTT